MRKMESGQCVPKKSIFKSRIEAWAWTALSDLMPCTCSALCQAKMLKKAGPWPLQTFSHPWNWPRSQQSPVLEAQLSIHVTGRRAKSTGTVKMLWGLPMAKCKYKNVTTYPSSTNFIILLRQAVKFFSPGFISLSLYTHIIFPIVFFMFTDSLFAPLLS